MRVLMFGWEFPPLISGGLGTACYAMTKHLALRGEKVTIVLPRSDGVDLRAGYRVVSADNLEVLEWPEEEFSLPPDVKIWLVRSPLIPYINQHDYTRTAYDEASRTLRTRPAHASIISLSGHYSHDLLSEVARYAEVGWLLGSRGDFDVIHAHDWMTIPAAMAAKRKSGKPFVFHVHATEYDRTGGNPDERIKSIEYLGLCEADHVIAVSQRTKSMLITHYKVPHDKITVVHNAIQQRTLPVEDLLQKRLRQKLIIFVGRITIQKGPEYFLHTAADILRESSDYRFVMCGAGDLLPHMIEEAARLRIQNKFHFTGFLSGSTLESLYAMADAFVMTSVSEPFGLTPFEAMRYNTPVIISKQAGAAELLPEQFLVDFWDTKLLAKKIKNVCENERIRSGFITIQNRVLSRMSWDKVASNLVQIYQSAVI